MDKQILVVGSDPLLSRDLTYSLKNAGYETEVVDSAEDALTLTDAYKPDVMLSGSFLSPCLVMTMAFA